MFLIINEDLSEELLNDTVQLLNVPLEKRSLKHAEWPSLLLEIKIYTISLVLNLSSSHWSQGEYLCLEDIENIHIFKERTVKKYNWVFRNSYLTRTCEMSDIPTFPVWKWNSSPISHFIDLIFVCTYLATSKLICIMPFMTHFLNACFHSALQFGPLNCPEFWGKWKKTVLKFHLPPLTAQ